MTQERKVVAVVEERSHAVDHTPIIRFRACRTIKPGTLFEWDEAENKLVVVADTHTQ